MRVNATESLGFGFPGMYSQAQGAGARMGTPYANFRAVERVIENMPPQAKARARIATVAGLRGRRLGALGQDDWITLTADDFANYPPTGEFPSDQYYAQVPGPYSWPTSIQTPITTSPQTASGTSINWDAAIANVQKLIQAGLTWDAQRKILDINLARAQAGLAPIDASRLSPGLNFGVTPDTQKMLLIGGIGLAAVLLLSRRKK